MPGNLQTENIVFDPSRTIVVSLTTTPNFLSLSLSLSKTGRWIMYRIVIVISNNVGLQSRSFSEEK
jgi:hypothetical protein